MRRKNSLLLKTFKNETGKLFVLSTSLLFVQTAARLTTEHVCTTRVQVQSTGDIVNSEL